MESGTGQSFERPVCSPETLSMGLARYWTELKEFELDLSSIGLKLEDI
jgi:hypothetical protein